MRVHGEYIDCLLQAVVAPEEFVGHNEVGSAEEAHGHSLFDLGSQLRLGLR
jgi:hypothetical protein